MPKALIVAKFNSGNKYVDELYRHFTNDNWSINVSIEAFWDYNTNYDIIHIQWIESLFNFELEGLCQQDIDKLKFRLKYLKERNTKIIVTRHNKLPHFVKNELVKTFFETVYNSCTGIIHLGDFSVNDFQAAHNSNSKKIEHKIINHGNYFFLKNNIARKTARNYLRIADKRFVILVFGSIRDAKERKLAMQAFHKAHIPNKTILFNRWGIAKGQKLSWKSICDKIKFRILNLTPKYALFNKFTADDNIQLYLNAADVLFIPRINTLNSGNLFLGLTFGKIVVGPAIGNLTKVIEATGNILFYPENITSVSKALEQSWGLCSTSSKLSITNMEYAKNDCNWERIAKEHIDFYALCLSHD